MPSCHNSWINPDFRPTSACCSFFSLDNSCETIKQQYHLLSCETIKQILDTPASGFVPMKKKIWCLTEILSTKGRNFMHDTPWRAYKVEVGMSPTSIFPLISEHPVLVKSL